MRRRLMFDQYVRAAFAWQRCRSGQTTRTMYGRIELLCINCASIAGAPALSG
jgi:hypothetical protein